MKISEWDEERQEWVDLEDDPEYNHAKNNENTHSTNITMEHLKIAGACLAFFAGKKLAESIPDDLKHKLQRVMNF